MRLKSNHLYIINYTSKTRRHHQYDMCKEEILANFDSVWEKFAIYNVLSWENLQEPEE